MTTGVSKEQTYIRIERLTIASMDLCFNLNTAVGRDEFLRNRNPLVDWNALFNDSIVLHVGHAKHSVNLGNAEPMEDIGHESLESHIFHASNVLSSKGVSKFTSLHTGYFHLPLKVFRGLVRSALPSIVDQIFGNFAQCSPLLTEVNNHTASAILRFFYRLLDTKDQVGTTRANVRTEDITSIALIVDTKGQSDIGIGDFGRVAEDIDG